MSLGKWLKTAEQNVLHFLGLLKDDAQKLLVDVDNIVNKIKTFALTPTGTLLETLIESFIPANLLAKFMLWLPTVFTDLNWAKAETGKTDQEIIADGAAYLGKLVGNIKSVQLNTLFALIATWLGEQTGNPIPIQQSLTVAQVVHNPTVDAPALAPAQPATDTNAVAENQTDDSAGQVSEEQSNNDDTTQA